MRSGAIAGIGTGVTLPSGRTTGTCEGVGIGETGKGGKGGKDGRARRGGANRGGRRGETGRDGEGWGETVRDEARKGGAGITNLSRSSFLHHTSVLKLLPPAKTPSAKTPSAKTPSGATFEHILTTS